jgi:hypothetical protein
MKTIITNLIVFFSILIQAQQPLDTIYANDKMNVALFFPNQIRQGITGTDRFVFTYNREKEQYFGLLQATPGEASNLLAITNEGQVYSYFIKYSERLSKLNYFINEFESIGNEKPRQKDSLVAQDSLKKINFRFERYTRFSEYLLKSKYATMASKRNNGLILRLLKMVYNKDEVYLVMEIKNNSKIDFEVDYLNISRVKGDKKRKASYQSIEQEVIYRHDMPNMVRNKNTNQFVYVLSKFVLGDVEKLLLEVKELKGGRMITLKTGL